MELYAVNKDYIIPYLECMENATIADRVAANDAFLKRPLDTIISRDNNGGASIKIIGFLSLAGPSPLARFFGFGGTGYSEIIAAAKELEDDPTVSTVKLVMDTPGGVTVGLDQTHNALSSLSSKKLLIAENHGQISSAGYYLAVAAARIDAMSPLVVTGSIGVVIAGLDFTDAFAKEGIRKIKIISKNAPDKQADPTTIQGISVLQKELDAAERVFMRVVAKGRNTTDQDVIDNFGQGAVLIASDPDPDMPDALKAGMIDNVVNASIVDVDDNGVGNNPEIEAANSGENNEENIMDLKELKADHPAVFADAVAVGVEKGKTAERERVNAHITMGGASGDMELAIKCISDGAEHTAATNANYMAAQMNKTAVEDRTNESESDLETNGAGSDSGLDNKEAELVNALANELGVEING